MWLTEIIKQSILITGLVMVMMIFIEYINITSKGIALEKLQNKPLLQILLSAFLGVLPGCSGGFVVVSLYTHNLVSFGALVAMMIATAGDESFLMLAIMPKTSLVLFASLFVLSIITGLLVNKFVRKVPFVCCPENFNIHTHIHENHTDHEGRDEPSVWGTFGNNFKKPGAKRLLLLLGLMLFIVSIFTGFLEHEHHGQEHLHPSLFSEEWLNLIFAGLSLVTLVFMLFSTRHFIEEHVWNHIIKHHFLKILLWTSGTLLVIHFLVGSLDITQWMHEQYWIVLSLAILIGIIPTSGPHLVFVTLFATGTLPFSILLANSIVQEGHAGLPLLAETKKGFFLAKALKIALALLVTASIRLVGAW
ncbi:MAG: arsenic efflux protein [Bacteroidales bacterium]|nr:arsenic efflux protein [Bacteroidales bacterium]